MNEPQFIHLRLHSAYSLLEGAIAAKGIPKLCAADDMPAVALTDTGNLFNALEFSDAAAKAGVQPIMGCQLALAYASRRASRGQGGGAAGGGAARPGRGRVPEPAEAVLGQLPRLRGGAAARDAWRRWRRTPTGSICLTGGAEGPLAS